MCGIAEASLVAGIASGAMSAFGQVQQGKAAQAQANYQAAIERNNAIRADYLAEDAISRGKESERQERLRGRMLIGQMRAVLASSGQVVDEGTALDLTVDQAETNELNAQTVRNNAAREAQEFRIQATNSRGQADLFQLSGANAASSGTVGAAGTLLGSAASVSGKWYEFKKAGL
jgi:hypothetical protein